jgi:integrase
MNQSTQLWRPASTSYVIPLARVRGKLKSREAPEFRAVYWPNGVLCWEVTAYLIHLRKRGRETSTTITYASELSHWIRFAFLKRHSRQSFSDFDDADMHAFSEFLTRATKGRGKRRSGNQINKIICRALRMLTWLQTKIPGARLVGLEGEGANITVERTGAKKSRWQSTIYHPSFVSSSIPTVVRPISEDHLSELLLSCEGEGRRSFTRARDGQMVNLMAETGMRREEAVNLKVEDVKAALSGDCRLTVRTSKRKGKPGRQIPVSLETLRSVMSFVKVQRAVRLRRRATSHHDFCDEGWLFCSQTGSQFKPPSVTHQFARLRKIAGIKEKASPHMLRHRWITAQLLRMLQEVSHASPLSGGLMVTMLTRLAALSGHSDPTSLWIYVDLSYDKILAGLSEGKRELVKKAKNAALEIREILEQSLWSEHVESLMKAIMAAVAADDRSGYLSLTSRLERGASNEGTRHRRQ